jgi:hypothetical protein
MEVLRGKNLALKAPLFDKAKGNWEKYQCSKGLIDFENHPKKMEMRTAENSAIRIQQSEIQITR